LDGALGKDHDDHEVQTPRVGIATWHQARRRRALATGGSATHRRACAGRPSSHRGRGRAPQAPRHGLGVAL